MKTSRMTKLLSVLLSVALMLSLLPAQALAVDERTAVTTFLSCFNVR